MILGLFLIFGLVMFPAGWGNEKVRDYCGQNAAPFDLDQCDLGKPNIKLCIRIILAKDEIIYQRHSHFRFIRLGFLHCGRFHAPHLHLLHALCPSRNLNFQ